MKRLINILFLMVCVLSAAAIEKTILIGPKTIGKGWKDNIVIEARQFQQAKVGDIMTLYTIPARGSAQAAFQSPKDWQPIAPQYAYFSVKAPVRVTLTADILANLKQYGLGIGGHEYQIVRVTLMPATDMTETELWKGSFTAASDWSRNLDLQRSVFQGVRMGDALCFHVSKVGTDAAFKLYDSQWQPLRSDVDGVPLAGDKFLWLISDQMQLVKLQLAGADGVAVHLGGKSFTLDRISIVRYANELDPDESTAQRAPREYALHPGELFRGEKAFPADYSQNLRLTAAPFQELTTDYALAVSYRLMPDVEGPVLGFREQRGSWPDISGTKETQWRPLNGRTVVLPLDEQTLDKVKTKGLVISGRGFVLTKVMVVKAPK